MYNKVIMEGYLTKDIEFLFSKNGNAIAKSGIAVNRKFKKSDGTYGEEVLFIDIVSFGRTAEIANQYLHKGSHVIVSGRLDFQQWKATDGSNRSKHVVSVDNIVMLSSETGQEKKVENSIDTKDIPF